MRGPMNVKVSHIYTEITSPPQRPPQSPIFPTNCRMYFVIYSCTLSLMMKYLGLLQW
jgi:hypothetical protein